MFKKILILLVLVVFIAGCTGNIETTPKQPTNANNETQQLNNDISNVDTIDDSLGTKDLDNIDIDTNLF
ncbi:hypothetical protein GQ473_07300 [archaeon]|nr:hypothetical protein [archaeon]